MGAFEKAGFKPQRALPPARREDAEKII